jgi:hypothetical protein
MACSSRGSAFSQGKARPTPLGVKLQRERNHTTSVLEASCMGFPVNKGTLADPFSAGGEDYGSFPSESLTSGGV